MDQAPPIRNPFVHVLKFSPLEKAKVKSGGLNGRAYIEKESGATFLFFFFVESSEMLLWLFDEYERR